MQTDLAQQKNHIQAIVAKKAKNLVEGSAYYGKLASMVGILKYKAFKAVTIDPAQREDPGGWRFWGSEFGTL